MRRAIVIAMLLLVSCKSQESKAQQAREELASWAATGQSLASNWGRGAVKTPYAKSTLKVAGDELGKLRKPLANDAKAIRSLSEVSELFDELSDAVEQNDRAAAELVSRRFSSISSTLQKEKNASQSS